MFIINKCRTYFFRSLYQENQREKHRMKNMTWRGVFCIQYIEFWGVFSFCSCSSNSVLQEKYVETRTAEPGVLTPNIISHPSSPFWVYIHYTAGTDYTSIHENTQSSYFKLPGTRNELSRGAISGTSPSQKSMFPALLQSVFFVFPATTHKSRRLKFSDFSIPYNFMEMASGDVGTIMWYQGKDISVIS
jgi:hypothetical protein